MKLTKTERGFEWLEHLSYPDGMPERLASQSSAIKGDYEDALDRPGSSCLWIGNKHHLNREEVDELAARLKAWLKTGSMALPEDGVK